MNKMPRQVEKAFLLRAFGLVSASLRTSFAVVNQEGKGPNLASKAVLALNQGLARVNPKPRLNRIF